MSKSPHKVTHPDDILQKASDYLEYHVNIYVSTLLSLAEYSRLKIPKTIETNALLVAYLIHMRLIKDFLSKLDSSWETDVRAVDFFHDQPYRYKPLDIEQ